MARRVRIRHSAADRARDGKHTAPRASRQILGIVHRPPGAALHGDGLHVERHHTRRLRLVRRPRPRLGRPARHRMIEDAVEHLRLLGRILHRPPAPCATTERSLTEE
jgi:hypothetical protein